MTNAPERIWAGTDADFTQRWRTNDERGGTEYLRADIAEEALEALTEARAFIADGLETEGELEAEHSVFGRRLVAQIDAILARAGSNGGDHAR